MKSSSPLNPVDLDADETIWLVVWVREAIEPAPPCPGPRGQLDHHRSHIDLMMEVKLHSHRQLKILHKAQESRARHFRPMVVISTALEAVLNQVWGLEKSDPYRCLSSLAQDLACPD